MTDITTIPNGWIDEYESLTMTLQKRIIYALRYYARDAYGRDYDLEPLIIDLLRQLAKETDMPVTRAALLQYQHDCQKEQRKELLKEHEVERDANKRADLEDRIRILNSHLFPRL